MRQPQPGEEGAALVGSRIALYGLMAFVAHKGVGYPHGHYTLNTYSDFAIPFQLPTSDNIFEGRVFATYQLPSSKHQPLPGNRNFYELTDEEVELMENYIRAQIQTRYPYMDSTRNEVGKLPKVFFPRVSGTQLVRLEKLFSENFYELDDSGVNRRNWKRLTYEYKRPSSKNRRKMGEMPYILVYYKLGYFDPNSQYSFTPIGQSLQTDPNLAQVTQNLDSPDALAPRLAEYLKKVSEVALAFPFYGTCFFEDN